MLPARKEFVPRKFQPPAIRHILEHLRCAIWATPGCGKTTLVLTAIKRLMMVDDPGPILVIGPLRPARDGWTNEALKWKHLEGLVVVSMVGPLKHRLAAVQQPAHIYTINYEMLEWLAEYWGDRWPYRIVVADEADNLAGCRLHFKTYHKRDGTPTLTKIEGEGGKRAKALGMVAHYYVDRFIELTGTPVAEGVKDAWGQLWFLDGGARLGRTHTSFIQRWFQTSYGGQSVKALPHALSEITAAVSDICLSIDAKDYFPLKDPVIVIRKVQLPPAAHKLYKTMEREFYAEIGGEAVTAANAGVKSLKTLQFASGAVYTDPKLDVEEDPDRDKHEWKEVHREKINELASIIGELRGATVIVVYEFASDLERLLKAFPSGRRLKTKKDEDDFRAGSIPILFCHMKSAGHGIEGFQTRCHHLIFFSQNWSLRLFTQMVERIGPTRQYQSGFDRNVFLYFIIAEGTVDEDVMLRRETKCEVQDAMRAGTKRLE